MISVSDSFVLLAILLQWKHLVAVAREQTFSSSLEQGSNATKYQYTESKTKLNNKRQLSLLDPRTVERKKNLPVSYDIPKWYTVPQNIEAAKRFLQNGDTYKCIYNHMINRDLIGVTDGVHKCVNLLISRMKKVRDFKSIRWAFFGDSTTFMMAGRLRHETGLDFGSGLGINPGLTHAKDICRCIFTIHESNCGAVESLGYKPPSLDNFQLPNMRIQGPTKNGLINPSCSDCNGCNLFTTNCLSSCPHTTHNFFPLEFANDVALQMDGGPTKSQDVVAKYMTEHKSNESPYICVMNNGLHDMSIRLLTLENYLQNLMAYFEAFNDVCLYFIWITTNSPSNFLDVGIDDNSFPQTIEKVREWNKATVDLIHKLYPDKATIIDQFEYSLRFHHHNHIHLDYDYYVQLGEIFVDITKLIENKAW